MHGFIRFSSLDLSKFCLRCYYVLQSFYLKHRSRYDKQFKTRPTSFFVVFTSVTYKRQYVISFFVVRRNLNYLQISVNFATERKMIIKLSAPSYIKWRCLRPFQSSHHFAGYFTPPLEELFKKTKPPVHFQLHQRVRGHYDQRCSITKKDFIF